MKSLIDDVVKGYFYGRVNIADAKNCLWRTFCLASMAKKEMTTHTLIMLSSMGIISWKFFIYVNECWGNSVCQEQSSNVLIITFIYQFKEKIRLGVWELRLTGPGLLCSEAIDYWWCLILNLFIMTNDAGAAWYVDWKMVILLGWIFLQFGAR